MLKYITETHEKFINGQKTCIINLTPELQYDEKNSAKKVAESRLFDIFCKYTKNSKVNA